jgi:hypothetical protein
MHPLDPWRAANLLVQQYGDGAADHSALRLAAMRAAGDADGAAVWVQISEAVQTLAAMRSDARPTFGQA